MPVVSQTLIVIILTCLVSIPAFNNRKVLNDLMMYPPAINKGQWYRFLTSGFVHADWMHLFFNMFTLWSFGGFMEPVLNAIAGRFGFLIFYITAVIVSDIPSYIKNRNNDYYASLGASGGVSAIVFGFILFQPWAMLGFPPVPAIIYAVIYVAYSTWSSRKGNTGINHDAHLFGALYGVLFIVIAKPEVFSFFLNQLTNPKWD